MGYSSHAQQFEIAISLIFRYDFGLARRYVDKNGNHQATRHEVGWRGTTRYGSLNAHLRQDLSRRDDIESRLSLHYFAPNIYFCKCDPNFGKKL